MTEVASVAEYKSIKLPLATDQAAALQASGALTVTPALDGTGYELKAASQVGMVAVRDLVVEILPKIGIERTLYLASHSLDHLAVDAATAPVAQAPNLVDAMATLFAAAARRALKAGVLQGYRVEEDALSVVRGRIRFDELVRRRQGRTPPIDVRFDEFTEDIELNQILRAAVNRLRHLPLQSATLRVELRHLDHLLANVTLVDYEPHALPAPVFDRLTVRYRTAVQLGLTVLRSTSAELGHGTLETHCFLMDMNRIFEDFVTAGVRRELRLSTRSFPQNAAGYSMHLDRARRIRLRPDLSWWKSGRCVFVGDVKYKRVDVGPIKHADLYQLLAYVVAADLPAGLLIYAKGEREPAVHTVRQLGRKLEVVAFDLEGSIEALDRQLREVARRVRDLEREAAALVA